MKRRILVCLTAILTLCPAMHAQTARHQGTGTATDSAFIFRYPPCIQMFKENYRENRQTLRRLKHTLKTFTKGRDTLYVNGFSGECETDPRNRRTVFYRCNNLKGYLIKYYKLREKDFKTTNHPYLHPEAGDVVIISLYPPRTAEEVQAMQAEAVQADTLQVHPRPEEAAPHEKEDLVSPKEEIIPQKAETLPADAGTIPAKAETPPSRWYVGIELGMPFGVSTFTSFDAAGKAGFEGGVLGGYRISPLLSVEAGIALGTMRLGTSPCCADYWLGTDGVRYLEHVAGMDSYSYRDIHSSVFLQQYALRLNADLLQIVRPCPDRRWSLTLSPAVYGIGTRATLKENATDATVVKRHGRFQFGAGVGIGGSYQLTGNLDVGLRSGVLWIPGERFDGITPTDHQENMIWNNTVTLIWRFDTNNQ